jgi:hypothetical protein
VIIAGNGARTVLVQAMRVFVSRKGLKSVK